MSVIAKDKRPTASLRHAPLRRAGVREVAERVGVSVATVSRVLNGSARVSPDTRARVQAVLDEMGYLRHGAARALSSRQSRMIGVIVPVLGTAVFAEAVQALQERLQELGYYLITAGSGYNPQKEFEIARAMIEHGVDGLLLVGGTHRPELAELLGVAGIPVIQTFVFEPQSPLPCIGFDNFQPSYRLVEHLIDLGHRRFAVLSSRLQHNDRIASRHEGILRCLADHGIEVPAKLQVEVGHAIADGRDGLRALLASGERFTALACTGDVIAVGALLEARVSGLAVPGQLSITGFHDLDLASHVDPPLTTVHVPLRRLGRTAAESIVARIAGEPVPHVVELPTSIILRRSIGPAPAGT